MNFRKALTQDTFHVVELIQSTYKVSYRNYLPDEYKEKFFKRVEKLLKLEKLPKKN